jgi:hypothetical protein
MEARALNKKATGALKYQYEQLIKHLLLLQDHAAAQTCPYSPTGEMCTRKHLLTLEAYAEETIPMEENLAYQTKLQNLDAEASNYRLMLESAMCGEEVRPLEGLEHWTRQWRKEFEMHSLACELQKTAEESQERTPEPALQPG